MQNGGAQPNTAPYSVPPLLDRDNPETQAGALDAEARSRQLLTAMTAFRDGDFSVRLPNDWINASRPRLLVLARRSVAMDGFASGCQYRGRSEAGLPRSTCSTR
jgi:hypothetical protein